MKSRDAHKQNRQAEKIEKENKRAKLPALNIRFPYKMKPDLSEYLKYPAVLRLAQQLTIVKEVTTQNFYSELYFEKWKKY